jgi:[acyl-carrier-protein] S-malonyltransferase
VRQAWHPVRWVETIRAMKARGVTHVVECGPGKVLAAGVRAISLAAS